MDWQGLMRLGLFELRLKPAEFWDLTPIELLVMTGQAGAGDGAMNRSKLNALIARYPDEKDD
ncbi:MAG: rcc01693 family protein [Pseudomonadota bacterium]